VAAGKAEIVEELLAFEIPPMLLGIHVR